MQIQDGQKLDYCKQCFYRLDKRAIENSTITDGEGRVITPGKETLGDTGKFCELGYKTNPKTFEATKNAMDRKAEVCRFNPFKGEIYVG
jgi:hypothetical protein